MNNQLERERIARCDHRWPVFRLKRLTRLKGGGTPSKDNETFWTHGDIPWVSPKDMKRRIITETEDYITADAVDGSATSFVEAGSPLVVVRSGILRHTLPVAIAGCRVTLNQDMKAFALRDNVDANFFTYWIEGQSKELLLEWRQFGATVESIDTARMMNGLIALPNLSNQRAIVDFLDRETVRIDRLIEKKQRQVTLLADKRNIQTGLIISDLGREHPRQSLRWLIRVRSGDFIDNTEMDKEKSESMAVPVIGGNGIMAFSNKHNAQGNIVIVGRVGALCGNVHFTQEKAWITDNALIITLVGCRLSPRYLFEALTAAKLNDKANKSAQPLITGEMVKAHKVAAPSIKVQARACEKISVIRNEFNRLTQRIDESLFRLREFRVALITAVVTGRIDVATWGKRGTTDRRLDDIQAEMVGAVSPEPEAMRA